MATLLIDLGALAIFLGYVATVYWYAVSQPRGNTSHGRDARALIKDRSP